MSRFLTARSSFPAVLTLAACLSPVAFGQEATPPAPTSPAAAPVQGRVRQSSPQAAQGDERPLLSVEFRGGTVAEFVEAVKEASPMPVNVVGPAEAMKMIVPAVSLKNVTAYMALQTLEYVNERRGAVTAPGMSTAYLQVMDLNRAEALSSPRSQTFAIAMGRGQQAPTPPLGPMDQVSTQVYAVRDLLPSEGGLPGLSIEQIVEPLEAALNVDAGDGAAGEPAKLMVHKASNLILVRGTAKQNALVRQVLDRLKDDLVASRAGASREREQNRIAEELRKQYKVRQQMLEMQLAQHTDRLAMARAQLDKARDERNQEAKVAAEVAVRDAASSLEALEKQLMQSKMQEAEVPFEASRQARQSHDGTAAALRQEIEGLRRQIEDLRAAVRSGSK